MKLTRETACKLIWISIGLLLGIGIVGILTVGIFLLVAAALLAVVAFRIVKSTGQCAVWSLFGIAVAPFMLAWVNRKGPGRVCTESTLRVECVMRYSPWPFVACGVLICCTGLFLATRHRAPRHDGL